MHTPPSILTFLAATTLVSSSVLPLSPLSTRHNNNNNNNNNDNDNDNDTPLPLIIWHGLGDNYAADGIAAVGETAQEVHPGILVYNIRLDDDPSADRSASFFGNLTLQIDKVCADLSEHPIVYTAPAIDALGFSQGGQFLRAYVERCNRPPVRSLVTFGSQHNGISEFQSCGATDWLCRAAGSLLKGNTWSDYVQSHLVPAQFYRDPLDLDAYLEHSNFLADINNEREVKNATYKANLAKLQNFVMYLFTQDKTVVPKESGWFADVNGTEVTALRDRDLYREDWLGLKELDERGALKFEVTEGEHMQFSEELLKDVLARYMGPERKSGKDFLRQDTQEL